MRTLEDILNVYFGCETPFDSNGEFTAEGSKSYDKLLLLLADLTAIGVFSERDYELAVRRLDEISDISY